MSIFVHNKPAWRDSQVQNVCRINKTFGRLLCARGVGLGGHLDVSVQKSYRSSILHPALRLHITLDAKSAIPGLCQTKLQKYYIGSLVSFKMLQCTFSNSFERNNGLPFKCQFMFMPQSFSSFGKCSQAILLLMYFRPLSYCNKCLESIMLFFCILLT